jgi:hypothetical protein
MLVRLLTCSAVVLACFTLHPGNSGAADSGQHVPLSPGKILPFQAGERLVYEISWSNVVEAGRAVMEVSEEQRMDGKSAFRLVSTATSAGIVDRFYKVSDTVESSIDTNTLCSLSFRLDQRHGKRKRKREMIFDNEKGTVLVMNNGKQETYSVPGNVQDALSSLYYVRAHQDFIAGKPIIVNVHEDGKTWAVEVHTLGREKLKTVLGEVDTIKIKTYPRYEGVFQNKGEIYIWLTDDARKIPVLMKSTITIGTIVSTLVEMKTGEESNDTSRIKASVQNH